MLPRERTDRRGGTEKGLEGVKANNPGLLSPVVNPIELTFDLSVDYLKTG